MGTDIEFFVINKNPGSLKALPKWLKNHHYNSWTIGNEDKNGNPFIPIRWDDKPGSDWGKPHPATGIVLIKDGVCVDDVEKIIRSESK